MSGHIQGSWKLIKFFGKGLISSVVYVEKLRHVKITCKDLFTIICQSLNWWRL